MMSEDAQRQGQEAVETSFEGGTEFADVMLRLLQHAQRCGARAMWWCDEDFASWPLGRADWVDSLTQWARGGGRELWMLAADYREIERLHPRFAAWRRDWAHIVHCLVPDEVRTIPLPTLWLDDLGQVARVFDRDHWRGRADVDRADRQQAREQFDANAQRASPGFAVTTLGL